MNGDNQRTFIDRVRRALNVSADEHRTYRDLFPESPTEVAQSVLKRIEDRGIEQHRKLLDQLTAAGKPINLKVIAKSDTFAVSTAIAGLVREKEPEWGHEKQVTVWKHPLVDRLNLTDALARLNVAVHETTFENTETEIDGRNRIRKHIIGSFVGITSADYCVADSATLVMKTRPGQARAASLAPSIHIAVIYIDQVIADLKELYTLLKHDPEYKNEGLTNCLTFISGPSKTADIEAVMVNGAHGPRELHLFVVADR